MSDAGWALAGVVIGGLFAGIINYFLQKGQFKHNKEMFVLQNQSTEVVKSLLAEKLSNESYTDRSFEALKQPIGGYSDDEVRQLLHEIGAMKVSSRDGTEWWYLLSRENERKRNQGERNA